MSDVVTTTAATDLDRQLEEHRPALVAHCRRIIGQAEAEDAVQEAIVRAWRSHDRFEGRASLRTWLFRIATNVCLDMATARQRRAHPVEAIGSDDGDGRSAGERHEPVGGAQVPVVDDDPAERAAARERVRDALLATLLHLPPRQRSVLILRDVLRWRATEVAELLGTTEASANSALARARVTMARCGGEGDADPGPGAGGSAGLDAGQRALLQRCTDAFERYDFDALVASLS